MQEQENTQASYGRWQSSEPHSLSSIIAGAFYDRLWKRRLHSTVAVLYVSWRPKDAKNFSSFF